MKKSAVGIIAGTILLSSTLAVQAGDGPRTPALDWTGLSVGIGVGAGAIVHELDATPGPFLPPGLFSLNSNGTGGEGGFATLSAGYDWQFSNMVIGVFADVDFSGIESNESISVPPAGGLTVRYDIEVEDVWSIGLRVGTLLSKRTLWFVEGGYTHMDVDDLTFRVAGPITATATVTIPDFDGFFIGGGAETKLRDGNWTLKGVYRFSEFDSETLGLPTVGGVNLNNFVKLTDEPSMHVGRVSLNYKFSSGGWR